MPPSGRGKVREGSLANEGTSLRGMDNNSCFFLGGGGVCVTGNFGVREYSAI